MNLPETKEGLFLLETADQLDQALDQWVQLGKLDQILEAAETAENLIPQLSRTSSRILKHYQAIAYLDLGAPNKALKIFQQAILLGKNISLSRDLACCYYRLNEVDLWRKHYQTFAAELHNHRTVIRSEIAWNCQIILGKFYEEDGHIKTAHEFYKGTLEELVEKKSLYSNLYINALTQMVRIEALMLNQDQVSQLYSELVAVDKSKLSESLRFEIQHSMMIAELVLVGPLHAWERVKESLREFTLLEEDKRLLIFDFIEEALLAGQELPDGIREFIQPQWVLSAHEEQVYRFFSAPETASVTWLTRLTPRLSSSSCLRGQILYLAATENSQLKKECHRKIQLLLGALPAEARTYWLQKITPHLETNDLTLKVVKDLKTIRFQNRELDLSRKKGMLQIMNHLGNESRVPVDTLINSLWSSKYTPEHFHRLRMTIHRLNGLLFDLTSIQKVVEFDSDQVHINPNIQITHLSP